MDPWLTFYVLQRCVFASIARERSTILVTIKCSSILTTFVFPSITTTVTYVIFVEKGGRYLNPSTAESFNKKTTLLKTKKKQKENCIYFWE